MPVVNVERIMGTVRMALIRRNAGTKPPEPGGDEQGLGTGPLLWGGARSLSEAKSEYRLDELLVYSDREFVENAYRVILRRAPDPEGLAHHLERLRAGVLSKVEVLGQLRWSAEGRGRGVHVDGLLAPYTLYKLKRRQFVGPIIRWFHGAWRLGAVADRLEGQEARLGQAIDALGTHANRMSLHLSAQISALDDELRSLSEEREHLFRLEDRVGELRSVVDSLMVDTQEITRRLDDTIVALGPRMDRVEASLPTIDEKLGFLQSDVACRLDEMGSEVALQIEGATESRLGPIEVALGHSAAAIDTLGPRVDAVASKLAALSPQLEELLPRVDAIERPLLARERANQVLDPLYVAFERTFRGSPQLIESRAEPYLEILREANVGGPSQPVLDIGPGNGEWLDVLRRNGFSARGVDTNHLFVELCTGRGLQVEHADAVEYLRLLPDGSLGAITALHVVEHLAFEVLVELLDEARRALCIGGVIVLETPNPENLLVASHYFYTDPTHRNPIPPETLRWIVEARGFERCCIERLTVARELPVPKMLPGNAKTAKPVSEMLVHFNAAPDYAVVGRRL